MKKSWWVAVLFVLAVLQSLARADSGEEDQVKEAFVAFQTGLKAGDADKLWPLLDTTTQAAVTKAASAP